MKIQIQKELMIFLKISLIILIVAGCSRYDYSIHKPKVRYKPSYSALSKILNENRGKRYCWAEEGPRAFDCSGLTYYAYGSMGIEIPRVAYKQFQKGTPIPKDQLQYGDLVFFDTKKHFTGTPTHVGIYIGNGMFEHASQAKGKVTISSLNSPYFKRRYLGARRYLFVKNNYIAKTYPTKKFNPISSTKSYTSSSYKKSNIKRNYYIDMGEASKVPISKLQQLVLAGFNYRVVYSRVDGSLKKRVLIGPFPSLKDAKRALQAKKRIFGKDVLIVKV
ncbi:MAG: hypothetical protein GXO02_05240 [Epsilonproteobacteria bacterium]|nr:hypothetical protein [Campylobacterota bacterium]